MIERRYYKSDVRADDGENDLPVIRGYAAVFNSLSEDLGGFREIIRPGAFAAVLENDVRALVDHESSKVLGRNKSGTLVMKEDDKGLYVEITPPETSYARDLIVSLRRGDIDQMSFAFKADDFDWEEDDDGQRIRSINTFGGLYDVSVVTYPAYPDTSVAVRSLNEWLTRPRLERAKRFLTILSM